MKFRLIRKKENKTRTGKDAYGLLVANEQGGEMWLNTLQNEWSRNLMKDQEFNCEVKQLGNSLWVSFEGLPRDSKPTPVSKSIPTKDMLILGEIFEEVKEIKRILTSQAVK